jgi:hypothetical protein
MLAEAFSVLREKARLATIKHRVQRRPPSAQNDIAMTEDFSDDEYELEPVDPDVLKHQQDRAQRKTREAEDSVDINAVFDQDELVDPIDVEQLKQFRFTTRHLLIATALLSMVMTLYVQLGGCMSVFVSSCVALATGWWFVMREERRRMEKVAAARKRYKQRLAARRAVEDGQPLPDFDAEEAVEASEEEEPMPAGLRFTFSMKEIMITFAVASVILAFAQILGFENAALVLGFVALAGLLVQAFGVELPPLIVFGWWLLLVLYLAYSLWSTFGSSAAA